MADTDISTSATSAMADHPAAGQSPAERAEAHRYGTISLACTLADMAIDFIYLGLMAFVFARPLDAWLASFSSLSAPQSMLRLLALFRHRDSLHIRSRCRSRFIPTSSSSTNSASAINRSAAGSRNWLSATCSRSSSAVRMNVGLFWIIWHTGHYWWLIAAAAFFVVSIVLGQLAPVLIVPLFYKVEPIEQPEELDARMKRLAEGTGLTIEGVYRLGLSADTQKANAMLAGLGRTRRVLMGDTLLEKFTPEEIDVIFAHELGHHVHRHIPKMIATGVVVSLAGFYLIDRVTRLVGRHSDSRRRAEPPPCRS